MNKNHSYTVRLIGDYEGLSLPDMEALSFCFSSLAKIAKSLDYPAVVVETMEDSASTFRQYREELERNALTCANCKVDG